jgi:hypothetical protein
MLYINVQVFYQRYVTYWDVFFNIQITLEQYKFH